MKIVAGVFNPIAFDGRVQRACEALAAVAEVVVICPEGPPLTPRPPFRVFPVRIPSVGFLLGYVAFALAFVWRCLRDRPDLIHAHDYYMAAPGLIASRLTGARLVYDAHELILSDPETPLKSPLLRLFAAIERVVAPRAECVIAANQERASLMEAQYRLARAPVVVQNIPVAEGKEHRKTYRTRREGYVLVYQGVILLRRGLARILDALPLLAPDISLLVVGGGPDEERLASEIRSRGLGDRVQQLGRVPRTELKGILEKCDAGLLTYSYDSLNDLFCAPNKVFEYAQAGLPVLATDQEPLRRLVEGYGLGELIPRNAGATEVAEQIRRFATRHRSEFEESLDRFLADHQWTDEAERLRAEVMLLSKEGQSR